MSKTDNKANSKTKSKRQKPLHLHVRKSVERYFKDLDGECPIGLYDRVLSEVEKPLLEVVMKKTQGNQSLSARMLGINRNTLRKKLKQYSLRQLFQFLKLSGHNKEAKQVFIPNT